MRRFICLLLLATTVAGCSKFAPGKGGDPLFDGKRFRSNAKAVERADKRQFVATARPVSKSFRGAMAAAEYEGIRHCITFYGTSEIDWAVGPATPPQSLAVEKDTLSFSGTCRDPG